MDNQNPPQGSQQGTSGSNPPTPPQPPMKPSIPPQTNASGTPPSSVPSTGQSTPPPAPMPPQGMQGGDPYAAQMGMGDFGMGPPPPPPQDPSLANYHFGDANKNFKTKIKIPTHQLKFNEHYFLQLLAGSISLTKDEKWKIVQSVPKLRQEQVDELIRILEEEKEKFVELSPKHAAQLKKLEEQHLQDWQDLELRVVQNEKKAEDMAKADEIRKSLGL